MIGPNMSCQAFVPNSPGNGNFSEYCSHRLDELTARALAAELDASPAATPLWEQADQLITDQAISVQLVTPDLLDFVSSRVGNYQYSDQFGMMLDQLWGR
jgi:peptide/nickel transport system substrate-binding protein